MTIQIPYRGVIEIIGEHDTGKTIAALQTTNNTKDILFVDDDVKGEGTVRQMKDSGMEFDDYIDMASERSKISNAPTPDEVLNNVIFPLMKRITSKKRKVIIFDTWRTVYQSTRGHVERNQSKYSSVVTFRGNSTIIQGLISKVARTIEQKFINELRASCELLIVTHHVKDNYVNNIVIGKIPESSATFTEVCNMRMWLRRNQISKVPIILFLKRPNVPKIVKGKLQFTNIVPLKVTPTDKHESIWDAIREYELKPIESRKPTELETPTAEELAVISGTLTQEQQSYIKMMIEYNKQIEKELSSIESDDNPIPPSTGPELVARAFSELGMNGQMIAEKLGLPTIADVMKSFKVEYWETLKGAKK